jgi:hypothetical protein
MMNTFAFDRAPYGGLIIKIQKNSLPAVPRRGPEAGDTRKFIFAETRINKCSHPNYEIA